jgi:hypothetical protein
VVFSSSSSTPLRRLACHAFRRVQTTQAIDFRSRPRVTLGPELLIEPQPAKERLDGKNIFIAECKFWRGEMQFTETIDQILSYLTWRDTKAAIILFNRNKDFSPVLAKIKEAMAAHPNRKHGPGVESETRFRYVFGKPSDQSREIILTVMAFDVPSSSLERADLN